MALLAGEQSTGTTDFAPVLIEAATSVSAPVPPVSSAEPSSIEISVGAATVRIRGAADAQDAGAVLKALKVLA